MEARAQADAWISATAASNGNGNWTNLIGVPGTAALPIPGGANGYNGQVPRYSHHIRTNGSGNIIFFAVDGNLYDGDGYLIADARGTNCQECLAPGVLEFISLPMPGQCGVYYLFSSVPRSLTYDGSHVQVSILDMNEPNPRFQQADVCNSYRGRLIGLHDFEVQQRYPSLSAWELGVDYLLDPTAPMSLVVAQLPINPNGKSQSPMLRIVQGAGPNDPSFLFAIMTTKTFVYRLTNVGVDLVSPVAGLDHFPTYSTNDPFTSKQFYRDADVRRTANGDIRLVMTSGPGLQTYPFQLPIPPNHNMLAARFNGTTGTLVPGSVQGWLIDPLPNPCGGPGGNSAGGLAGCALDPSANGAWYLAETTTDCNSWQPKLAHIEFATGIITDASAQVPGLQAYVRSRMYRNSGPSNTEDIHIPHAGGVAAFQNTAVPATVTVTPSAFSGAFPPLHVDPPSEASSNYQPRFLNTAVQGDRHLSIDNIAQCCTYFQTVPGAVVGGHIQVPGMSPVSWDGASNPLQSGSSTLVFNCDLVVESGAQLILNNLTAKFTDGAKIIVKRGGTLRLNNSTATSLSCPNERWPGIQLEGQTHASNTPTNLQGNLRIYSSAVENAKVGVRTGRFDDPLNGLGDPAYYGGRVLAYNSMFKDCIVGARIERHHANTLGGGAEQPNQSLFSNCDFVTTTTWPSGIPISHIELTDVNHVRVHGSRFVNQDAETYTTWQRGAGIKAIDAAFTCLGYQNANNRCEGLTVGVLAMVPDPSEVYKVDGMTFFNNLHGVFDFASTGGVVTNNKFTTLASPTPLTSSSVGLSLFNAEGYIVERNTFTDQGTSVPSVGIHFLGQSYQNNEVYDNEFNDLNIGCMVQGRHAAYNATEGESLVPGLQMRCGDHLGNLADQVILYDGWIRHNQGLGETTQKLANNRFLSSVTCDPGNNTTPSVHTYVAAAQPTGLYVNYHFYKHEDSPEQRQDCVEDQFGTWLSLTGEYFYDLNGHDRDDPFDKSEHCNSGKLDLAEQPGGNGTGLQSGYMLKQAELASAWQNYRGTMDRMKTRDLVGMIDHKPAHPSHALRDTLLGNFPLTDSVMITMLKREEPMDAWHLTQVLIQNSPLSPWVWRYIDHLEVLPSYFRALLLQYRNGVSLKQVLEQEIVSRQQEVQAAKVLLLDSLANDTMVYGRMQLINGLFEADSLGDGLRGRYVLALLNGDFATAAQLADELGNVRGMGGLLEWGDLYMAHDGNLDQFSAAARDDLYQMAMDHAPAGGGLAWATLYHLAELDSLPTPEIPVMFKSLPGARNRRELSASEAPLIGVFPNPATDRVAFTVPPGMEEGRLEVFDAQGRLIRTVPLAARTGLVEEDVRDLKSGLYAVSLVLGQHRLGTTKFTIVR